jgi:hypothetical protein
VDLTCRACAHYLGVFQKHLDSDPDDFDGAVERALDHHVAQIGNPPRWELDQHARELMKTLRPYPRGHSLPSFIETAMHFTRATFELDMGADILREDYQPQFWAPVWVKVVTDYFSDMIGDCGSGEMKNALICCRDEILLNASTRDPWLQYAIDSAWRLGGKQAAVEILPIQPHLRHARQPHLAELLREAEEREAPPRG